ncbi:GNAT family N-acetyltransferase [Microlunatus elymi]|uniref:GNAT family N-acetyltransferase n=1 Tax=Microlunatus elymi TaxID=2596828 RepID=A0A516Q3G5_9ACTN|nr:GNAT family N-acetyltransferase [Microlunatus elymi]QDP97751.1 GNAT family N-acetyltransferase [Microlunatus elymi]
MTDTEDDAIRLELLAMRHAERLERFERDNREFFASRISDRGDDYFQHFEQLLADRVAENESGNSLFLVLVTAGGRIAGRVNLSDIDDPARTELGFRVASDLQGRGIATRGVLAALEVARGRGVSTVGARVAVDNPGSRTVLERCGFAAVGPVEAPAGSPRTFVGYRLSL